MTTTTSDPHTTATDTTVSGSAPIGLALVGLMTVAAAFVALIVAGVAAGDVFSASGSASDQGVWMATQAWATALALTGLAVIFAGAIPLALRNVRSTISFRRDAMASGLPKILHTTDTTHTTNEVTTNEVTTTKENVR